MPGTSTRHKVSLLVALLVVSVFFAHRAASLEASAGIGVSADGSVAVDSSDSATASSSSHPDSHASGNGEVQQPLSSSSRQPLSHPVRQFDKLEESGEAIHRNHEVLATYQGALLPYTLLETLPHNRAWFTQGLFYHQGYLWEGTGLYGRSKVHRVKMTADAAPNAAGSTDASAPPDVSSKAALAAREVVSSPALEKEFFGEGLALVPAKPDDPSSVDRLVQLTYKEGRGFVYEASTSPSLATQGGPVREFNYDTYTGHGWGLAYDANYRELVVSDGSDYLFFWDADTFVEKRFVKVTLPHGEPLWHLNELEVINGSILANVWYSNKIVKIDRNSGVVNVVYDFNGMHKPGRGEDCFNGIALDEATGDLFVTGKKWSKLYRVRI